ncbi:MAG: helix-turn-helix domain-containing protein [Clostridiales bacterium]|nr:helix-turn-helix domain-containing protein [Clostridiales bacterium]
MAVGEYLKELRQTKGISQKELSVLTNGEVSNAEISRLEAGIRKKPSPAILKLLAPHLDVPVGILLTKAGYMDEFPGALTEEEMAGNMDSSPGSEPNKRYIERLQNLEDEELALKKENQKLSEEAESLRKLCLQWENKYNSLLSQGLPGAGEGAEDEDTRTLQEKIEKLNEENRRIKEETIVFLEEGASLRAEADGYRKRMTAAEDASRKARLDLEALQDELQALKEKGVMFGFESDEEQEQEFSRLKEETLNLINQKNDLLEENQSLTEIIASLERSTDAPQDDHIQESMLAVEKKLADVEKNLANTETKLADTEKNLTNTEKKLADTEKEIADLNELLKETDAEHNRLTKDNTALAQEVSTLKESLAQAESAGPSQVSQDTTVFETEIADLKEQLAKTEAGWRQLTNDKRALELDLAAAKEAAANNASSAEPIEKIQAAGMDLGSVFKETVKGAAQDDLDMLARFMIAIDKDTIKASDKRMLIDILKRFIK